MMIRPFVIASIVLSERYSPDLLSRSISSVKSDIMISSGVEDPPIFITGKLIRQPDELVRLTMLIVEVGPSLVQVIMPAR